MSFPVVSVVIAVAAVSGTTTFALLKLEKEMSDFRLYDYGVAAGGSQSLNHLTVHSQRSGGR